MMRPIIGIPLRYAKNNDDKPILFINESVRRSIQKLNAFVLVIPPVSDVDFINTKGDEFPDLSNSEKYEINEYLNCCNGIFLPGGNKFTPHDRYILDYAIKHDIPTLGVCLSMQMMSCYNEEVKLEKIKSNVIHDQENDDGYRHEVLINRDSKLYSIIGLDHIMVNSYHVMRALPNSIYKTVANSLDGVIEGIEHPDCNFNIGVQWHPEKMMNDMYARRLMNAFVEASKKYKSISDFKGFDNYE